MFPSTTSQAKGAKLQENLPGGSTCTPVEFGGPRLEADSSLERGQTLLPFTAKEKRGLWQDQPALPEFTTQDSQTFPLGQNSAAGSSGA